MENEIASLGCNAFKDMQQYAHFDILPCDERVNLEDKSRFTKLDISSGQKSQISVLVQSVPGAMAARTMSNAYTVRFPEGLPHVLTKLKQGGSGTMVRVNGRFAGSASLYEMSAQAAALGAFTAMSVASGQYFMAQINQELRMINLKVDKILEFLYGDKKAELMAEVSFVKYAYQNFASIMEHDTQRMATICSLQSAKKIAMKDIEFYVGDLDSKVMGEAKSFAGVEQMVQEARQIRESLELSMQLYIMSSLLEMQYSQNTDKGYVSYLEEEITSYIDKCDKRILSSFSALKGRVDSYKAKPMEKVDKALPLECVGKIIDSLNGGEESAARKAIRSMLRATEQRAEYYITQDGNVYISNSK